MTPCSTLQRWWHHRKREADKQCMIPVIKEKELDPIRRVAVFTIFTLQKGQEHWNCSCSDAERDVVAEDLFST